MKRNGIIITICVIVLIICCYFIGEASSNSYQKEEFSKDEQSELKSIDVDEYLKLLSSSETSVIYIARPTCSHCVTQTPRMKHIKYKYKVEINYLNTDNFNEKKKDYDRVIASADYFKENDLATPLILIVKDGKIIDKIEGESPLEDVVTLLSNNGLV